MRVGISFRIGPLRFYQPLNGGKKRKRKPTKAPVQYLTHAGCQRRHVSMNTLTQCAKKKGLPLPEPEDARPGTGR